jgi:hypothetical protein
MNYLIFVPQVAFIIWNLDQTILGESHRPYERMHPEAILATALPRIASVSSRQCPIVAALTT